jgi:hypothetical protein
LHQGVCTALGDRPGDVGVVEADVVALRRSGIHQRARLQIELFDAHVGRQGAALLVGHVGQRFEMLTEVAREKGRQESSLQLPGWCGWGEAKRRHQP